MVALKLLSQLRDTHLHATRVLFTTTHSTTSFPRHLAYEINGPLLHGIKAAWLMAILAQLLAIKLLIRVGFLDCSAAFAVK